MLSLPSDIIIYKILPFLFDDKDDILSKHINITNLINVNKRYSLLSDKFSQEVYGIKDFNKGIKILYSDINITNNVYYAIYNDLIGIVVDSPNIFIIDNIYNILSEKINKNNEDTVLNDKKLAIKIISSNIECISGLHKFTNIVKLDLSYNKIIKIEGLNNLTNLITLDLDNNLIEEIDGLDNLNNLKELNLSNNKIKVIDNLNKLFKLEMLNLGYNDIKRIQGIDKLVNLHDLYINDNEITKIENLDNLINLQHLNINNNSIDILENIDNLHNICIIFCEGNNFEDKNFIFK